MTHTSTEKQIINNSSFALFEGSTFTAEVGAYLFAKASSVRRVLQWVVTAVSSLMRHESYLTWNALVLMALHAPFNSFNLWCQSESDTVSLGLLIVNMDIVYSCFVQVSSVQLEYNLKFLEIWMNGLKLISISSVKTEAFIK